MAATYQLGEDACDAAKVDNSCGASIDDQWRQALGVVVSVHGQLLPQPKLPKPGRIR